MRRTFRVLIPLLLAGCGGGDGGSVAPPDNFQVTVQGSGDGSGSVTADGLACVINGGRAGASGCTATHTDGTALNLTASTAQGSTFGGWGSDAAECGSNVTCSLTVNRTLNIQATFTVASLPVAGVGVSPPTATLQIAATQQFTATLTDAQGHSLTGRQVAWTSSATQVATIDPASGLATAVAPGTTTITATSEGVSGTASLTVTSAFPNVAGVYSINGTFDGTPSSQASFAGTLTLAQPSLGAGNLTGSASITAQIFGQTFNISDPSITNANVSSSGVITFTLTESSEATWTFTGTASGASITAGRHTLASSSGSISGDWTGTRVSGVRASQVRQGTRLSLADLQKWLTR
jgi:hypothetical protein